MGGQSIVYTHDIEMAPFYLLRLFTWGGWVVKKDQNSVYVVIEWHLDQQTHSVLKSDSCVRLKSLTRLDEIHTREHSIST